MNTYNLKKKTIENLSSRELDKGLFAKFENETKVDFYSTISAYLSHYMIGNFDFTNKNKKNLMSFLKATVIKDNELNAKTYHQTAIIFCLLNLLQLNKYTYPYKLDKFDEQKIINLLEKEINWSGTLKDFWGLMWISYSDHSLSLELVLKLKKYFEKKSQEVLKKLQNDSEMIKISKIYHFISAVEVLNLKLPNEKNFINTLLSISFAKKRNECDRNECTDFDYAYALWRFRQQTNYKSRKILKEITLISKQRNRDWESTDNYFEKLQTSFIFNYLISTAVFQQILRESATGGIIPDVYNTPSLYIN